MPTRRERGVELHQGIEGNGRGTGSDQGVDIRHPNSPEASTLRVHVPDPDDLSGGQVVATVRAGLALRPRLDSGWTELRRRKTARVSDRVGPATGGDCVVGTRT